WGCTAYVHVQKDKRTSSLGPHMEKAIFIGYPKEYKGWKFYNPVTKCIIISERADFDERYFPGLKKPISDPPLTSLLKSSNPLSNNSTISISSPDDLDLPPLPPAPDSGGNGVPDVPDPSENKNLPQEPIPDPPSPTSSTPAATPPPPDLPLALR